MGDFGFSGWAVFASGRLLSNGLSLENNGKIRPQPDREAISLKASGGGDGTGVEPTLGRKLLILNEANSHHGTRIRFRRISAASIGPNLVQ